MWHVHLARDSRAGRPCHSIGTCILRVIHGRDARATPSNCITTFCSCHSYFFPARVLP